MFRLLGDRGSVAGFELHRSLSVSAWIPSNKSHAPSIVVILTLVKPIVGAACAARLAHLGRLSDHPAFQYSDGAGFTTFFTSAAAALVASRVPSPIPRATSRVPWPISLVTSRAPCPISVVTSRVVWPMVRPASFSGAQARKPPKLRTIANTVLIESLNNVSTLPSLPAKNQYISFRELSNSRHDEYQKTERTPSTNCERDR